VIIAECTDGASRFRAGVSAVRASTWDLSVSARDVHFGTLPVIQLPAACADDRKIERLSLEEWRLLRVFWCLHDQATADVLERMKVDLNVSPDIDVGEVVDMLDSWEPPDLHQDNDLRDIMRGPPREYVPLTKVRLNGALVRPVEQDAAMKSCCSQFRAKYVTEDRTEQFAHCEILEIFLHRAFELETGPSETKVVLKVHWMREMGVHECGLKRVRRDPNSLINKISPYILLDALQPVNLAFTPLSVSASREQDYLVVERYKWFAS